MNNLHESGSQPLLEVNDLSVEYQTDELLVKAVNHVSLRMGHKETIGLVGETGAGKTTLALTLMGLLPKGIGRVTSGEVKFDGRNLLQLRNADMMAYRGKALSMIFQDPMTSLNPVIPVGRQVAEVLELHNEKS